MCVYVWCVRVHVYVLEGVALGISKYTIPSTVGNSLDVFVLVLLVHGDVGAARLQLALYGLAELFLVHGEREV